MTNGYDRYLLAAYEAILTDYLETYPADRKSVSRDLSRLSFLVENRGIGVFTLDLPALGKHFDRCLSDGRLTPSSLPISKGSRRSPLIPRLFQEIMRRVFFDDGLLRTDPDITSVRFLRQLFYCSKKVDMKCDDSKTFETVKEFFRIEDELPSPSLSWLDDELDSDSASDLIFDKTTVLDATQLGLFPEEGDSTHLSYPHALDILHLCGDMFSAQLGSYTFQDLSPKHGPGAVSDQDRFENKFLFPNWPVKLDNIAPYSEFGLPNAGFVADVANDVHRFSNHEPPSVLIAVPKTMKGPRLIAKEPICHQWMQQAVRGFLERGLHRTYLHSCITFRSQERSRVMARQASLSGSHWTIDLSSASDRLSLWAIERMFRRNKSLLHLIHATRTRWLVNRIDKYSSSAIKLKKMAPQGSACTFPMQSIFFAIVACSAVITVRGLRPSLRSLSKVAREVQVFGDDIIVPKDAGALTMELLHYLKLKVNVSKSYGTGKFREACGMDAFDGHDVTPVYIRRVPERSAPESVVSAVGTVHNAFIARYHNLSQCLKSYLERKTKLVLPRVPPGSGFLGWPSEFGFDYTGFRTRYNRPLQRREVFVPSVITRRQTKPNEDSTGLLQFFHGERSEHPVLPYKDIREARVGIGLRPRVNLTRRWEPVLL